MFLFSFDFQLNAKLRQYLILMWVKKEFRQMDEPRTIPSSQVDAMLQDESHKFIIQDIYFVKNKRDTCKIN